MATFIKVDITELELPTLLPVPAEFITDNDSVEVELNDEEGNLHRVPSDWVLLKYNWETVRQYKARLRHYLYSLHENNMKVVLFCPPEEL